MQLEQLTLSVGITVRDPAGDRYLIEGLLGEGGSGAVYLVSDRRERQHRFALKEVIDPNQRARERLTFEGEVLQRLSHRALPRVYRVFEQDKPKRVYLLMDYIAGQDLAVLQNEQPAQQFPLPLVLALLAPIVDALSYLHHQDPPIVHRDIKPANIIVPKRGEGAMLVDFGTAKEYVPNSTTTAIRLGSPGFAAPEQYGRGTTPRTDIYGLGATLYTLLTGTVPPDSITRATAPRGHDPLEPAYLIATELPWGVSEAIGRAMSISHEDRFETVEQFWQEVTARASQQPAHRFPLPPVVTPQPLPPPRQPTTKLTPPRQHAHQGSGHWSLLSLVLAFVLSLAIGASFLAASPHGNPPPPHAAVPPVRGTPPAVSRTPTIPPGSPIPSLSVSYGGTILDIFNNERTDMFLTQVQQSQGHIRGYFQGLGLVGSFTGTVTSAGHVQFTVTVPTSGETITFEGDIKIGGDIVGSFTVFDSHGYRTGESGLWNVASSS